jgi:hypothetical protein
MEALNLKHHQNHTESFSIFYTTHAVVLHIGVDIIVALYSPYLIVVQYLDVTAVNLTGSLLILKIFVHRNGFRAVHILNRHDFKTVNMLRGNNSPEPQVQ